LKPWIRYRGGKTRKFRIILRHTIFLLCGKIGNKNRNFITGQISEKGLHGNSIGTFRLLWHAMGKLSIAAHAANILTGVALFVL